MGQLENIMDIFNEEMSYDYVSKYKREIVNAIKEANELYADVEITHNVKNHMNIIHKIIQDW